MGEDGFEFGVSEARLDPCGDAHHGTLRASSGGEGIGHINVSDGHARLGHLGQCAKAVHHGMELGRFFGRHFFAPHAEESDPVGEPVLTEDDRSFDDDDQHQPDAHGEEHGTQDSPQHHQHEAGEEHASRQTLV